LEKVLFLCSWNFLHDTPQIRKDIVDERHPEGGEIPFLPILIELEEWLVELAILGRQLSHTLITGGGHVTNQRRKTRTSIS